ncbi:MAG: thiamine pyrophosphate-binding protein, partial [Desulfuromonadaceae bacterium]
MAEYRCEVCFFVYDETTEGMKWGDLHEGWLCPVCESPKSVFVRADINPPAAVISATNMDKSNKPTMASESAQLTGRSISDLMVETMVNWGVRHVFGMVGHSNLGLADAIRKQSEAGKLNFIGIRHEG